MKEKFGGSFRVTDWHVGFLAAVRYLFSMPCRQLEGFTRALSRLIPKVPSTGYLRVRRHMLRLDLDSYKSLSS